MNTKKGLMKNMTTRKVTASFIAVLCTFAMLTGCGQATGATAEPGSSTSGNRKMIIDTDAGADDCSAIIYAARCSNVDILGVTTLTGNVGIEQVGKNALMALEIGGSDARVYPGSDSCLNGEEFEIGSVYGDDGMGDMDLIHPKGTIEDKDAIDFILETVNKYPDEVEIMVLGPATNIAKAIERDPQTMKKVKMIWSMGTAGMGHGNASPVAEFNVYGDAPAYKAMLDSGIGITIIGLDACDGDAQWTNKQFEQLEKSGEAGKFVVDSFTKLREFYAMNGSEDSVMNCDSTAMVCALDPDYLKETVRCHGSCIVDKGETYAQVLFYKEGFTYDVVDNDFEYNVRLVSEVDKKNYFNKYLNAMK